MNADITQQEAARAKLSTVLSGIEGPCSELHIIADILRSLSENNAGTASSCEVFLMAQILQERTKVIEGLTGQMINILKEIQMGDDSTDEIRTSDG